MVHGAEEAGALLSRPKLPTGPAPEPTAAPAAEAADQPPSPGGAPVEAAAARSPRGASPAARAAPSPDAAAAERAEAEEVAPFHPASEATRRGRLAAAVASVSPYTSPPVSPPTSPAAGVAAPAAAPLGQQQQQQQRQQQAEGALPEEVPQAPSVWQEAAQHPVAAVGGTTGQTHVGGPAALAAARLHAAPHAAAAAAQPETALSIEEQALRAVAPPDRPLSPVDVRKGQSLAAADMAAGHKAAADAAAAAPPSASAAEPAAPQQQQQQRGAAAAAPLQRQEELEEGWELPEAPSPPARQLPPAPPAIESPARRQQQEQLQERARPPEPSAELGAIMGPPPSRPRVGAAPAGGSVASPPRPLLPAGAFGQEQDISVFRCGGGAGVKGLRGWGPSVRGEAWGWVGPRLVGGPACTDRRLLAAPHRDGLSCQRLARRPPPTLPPLLQPARPGRLREEGRRGRRGAGGEGWWPRVAGRVASVHGGMRTSAGRFRVCAAELGCRDGC